MLRKVEWEEVKEEFNLVYIIIAVIVAVAIVAFFMVRKRAVAQRK